MARAVRTSLAARLVAVWIASTLTGAPALAARHEPGEHRCQCRAHARDHECECARCHEGTRNPHPSAEAKAVPPCHRAAVKDAQRVPPSRGEGRPCVTGYCGGADRPPTALSPLDAFTLPPAPAPGGALPPAGSVARPPEAQREIASVPETPPPRADRAPAVRA